MNKMINLVKNEYVKQYSKISIIVLTILLLAFSIVLPVFGKILFSLENENNSTIEQDYSNLIPSLDEEIKKLDAGNPKEALRLQFLRAKKEYIQFYTDNDIGQVEWTEELYLKYREEIVKKIAIGALLEGFSEEEITKAEETYSIDSTSLIDDSSALYEYFYSQQVSELSDEQLQSAKKKAETQINLLKNGICNKDFQLYNQNTLHTVQENAEEIRQEIEQIQKLLAESPANVNLKSQLQTLQASYANQEELVKINQYRNDHGMVPGENNWRASTLYEIEYNISNATQEIMTEKEYYDYYAYGTRSYEEYKIEMEEYKTALKDKIQVMWYSLHNDMPMAECTQSTRTLASSASVYLWVIPVFLLIIAAGLISKEYSKGTIRLLLIRPVARNKILASKVIMLFSLGIISFILCFGLHTLSSGFCFGFKDLLVPQLSFQNNQIVQTSFLLDLLIKLGISLISPVFTVTLAFLFSTMTKNTALSLTMGFVSMISIIPAAILVQVLGNRAWWLGYTPFPYIDFYSTLSLNAITKQESYGLTVSMQQILGKHFHPAIGLIEMIALSLLFICISFIIFKKRDVKN